MSNIQQQLYGPYHFIFFLALRCQFFLKLSAFAPTSGGQPLYRTSGPEPDRRTSSRAPGFDINAAGYMFLMVTVGSGGRTGAPAGIWHTLGRAACEANRGPAFCTGFPDSRRVRVRFPPGAPASRAIVLIKNMSRVNIQSAALTEGVDGDLACGPRVLRHSGCTALLWQEWVPCKFHCRLLLKKMCGGFYGRMKGPCLTIVCFFIVHCSLVKMCVSVFRKYSRFFIDALDVLFTLLLKGWTWEF